MLLVAHILIALSSIVYGGYTYLTPSKTKLRASYTLVALTLASGTYLVISTRSPLTSACVSGLTYLAFISAGLILARRKLEHSKGE